MTHQNATGFSRRAFLFGSTSLTVGAVLASSPLRAAALTGHNVLDKSKIINGSHWGVFEATVEGGRMVSTRPLDELPGPTAINEAMPDMVYSKTRVKYPMVRKGFLEKGHLSDRSERGKGEFVRVSWDTALDLVAKELNRVKQEHGNKAIYGGSYGWKSTGLLHNCFNGLYRTLNLHGGFINDVNTYSTGSIRVIMPYVIGGSFYASSSWSTVVENAEVLVWWGADPAVTCKINWEVPDHSTFKYLEEFKKTGKKVIVVDPVRNRTAEFFDAEWIAPRPGTDVAMMIGMAHTLMAEDLHDKEFLSEYCTGYDKFEAYLKGTHDGTPKTAEWASEICGIDAEALKELARTMAANRTYISMGWSIQRQHHGEQGPWMCFTLACMLGYIGLPGGGADFTYHYSNYGAPKANAPKFPGFPAGKAVEGMPPPIPVSRVPWCMGNPGAPYSYNGKDYTAPDIRLVYWTGGNPMHHHQDRNQHIQYWQKPETIIVNEINWTQTARFADIVLPATTSMERNDISTVGSGGGAVVAMKQVVPPLNEAKSDFEIFREISKRLGFEEKFTEGRDEMGWVKHIYELGVADGKKKNIDLPDFESFWNEKNLIQFEVTKKAQNYVQYSDFREDPLLNPVATPSGKFEIFSRRIEKYGYDDCPPHPTWMEPVERLGGAKSDKYPLHLTSSHPDDRLHSQLDNTWLRNRYEVQEREPVWINPVDAEKRGIKNGDVVRLFNDRGQILGGAIVTDLVRPNVVRMCEGGWYDPEEPGVVGTLCKHGDVNVLTVDIGTSKLAQGNVAHTALTEIEKYEGKLPPITTFDPPQPVSAS